jgi:hypothetical protein
MKITAFLILTSPIAAALGASDEVALERVGTLAHPAIREASGLVESRKRPGVFWTHNDSGNPAALFAVRGDGSLIREFVVAVPNVDWEDLAIDDEGRLYVGDIGNNEGRLPLRAIYRFDEPDPLVEPAGPLKPSSATYYRFVPDGRFDAEGLAIDGARALIVAKTFDGRDAEIYAVPLDPPAPLLRPAKPVRVARLAGFAEPATGAALHRDGKRLAVCSLRTVAVYRRDGRDAWRRESIRSFQVDDQIEAVAWVGDDLLLAGEQRGLYRVAGAGRRAP